MNTKPLGAMLRDIMRDNPTTSACSADETTSNKLDAIYEVTKKLWLAEYRPRTWTGASSRPTAG